MSCPQSDGGGTWLAANVLHEVVVDTSLAASRFQEGIVDMRSLVAASDSTAGDRGLGVDTPLDVLSEMVEVCCTVVNEFDGSDVLVNWASWLQQQAYHD